ncbi:uncharacterized protein ACBR49_010043 isoform 1-T1 [Aulostomus maculatus]
MIGNSSALAAGLTIVSVVSLSLVSLLCLRCKRNSQKQSKRKSKIIHEETQIYNAQIFQRAGSRFAVVQSKTVTEANQMRSTRVETTEECLPAKYSDVAYQEGSLDATYVSPLPLSVYENEDMAERIAGAVQAPSIYANIQTALSVHEDDYENAEFLAQAQEENDEPDYVNETVSCF